MISLAQLQDKIAKLYPKLLAAHVKQEDIFPLYIPADKSVPDDFAEYNRQIQPLIENSASHRPFGYHLEYETKTFRKHGEQTVIVRFRFDSYGQLLGFLDKQEAFDLFAADVALLLQAYPSLRNWMTSNTAKILQYHDSWPGILRVVDYFLEHPCPQVFIRELPIAVHSKFIEQHKGILYEILNLLLPPSGIQESFTGVSQFESRFGLRLPPPRIRMRLLDAGMSQAYTGGFTDIELQADELAARVLPLKTVIVLENKRNFENADIFLSLPELPATAVLFGSGKAVSLLARVKWLQQTGILYWGDMDAEGFEILDQLRSFFPATASCCMDIRTFDSFIQFAVRGSGAGPKALQNLRPEELDLYRLLCRRNLRLEQERIPHHFAIDQVREQLSQA